MLLAAILIIGTAVVGFAWIRIRHQRRSAQGLQ